MKMLKSSFFIFTSIVTLKLIASEEFAPLPLQRVCPRTIYNHKLCTRVLPANDCTTDNDCPVGAMCCPGSCGGRTCTKVTTTDDRCPRPNEIYNSCGSHCPVTCANSKPGPCILLCSPGCYCKSGYLRNSVGLCVAQKDC